MLSDTEGADRARTRAPTLRPAPDAAETARLPQYQRPQRHLRGRRNRWLRTVSGRRTARQQADNPIPHGTSLHGARWPVHLRHGLDPAAGGGHGRAGFVLEATGLVDAATSCRSEKLLGGRHREPRRMSYRHQRFDTHDQRPLGHQDCLDSKECNAGVAAVDASGKPGFVRAFMMRQYCRRSSSFWVKIRWCDWTHCSNDDAPLPAAAQRCLGPRRSWLARPRRRLATAGPCSRPG